ncbi:hypothetical protein BGZ58_003013, partial [Dissophora ornata]
MQESQYLPGCGHGIDMVEMQGVLGDDGFEEPFAEFIIEPDDEDAFFAVEDNQDLLENEMVEIMEYEKQSEDDE